MLPACVKQLHCITVVEPRQRIAFRAWSLHLNSVQRTMYVKIEHLIPSLKLTKPSRK